MKPENVVLALGALAHESRLSVYRELVKRGADGYTPGELSERLGIPAPTLSFHLKELQRADLVSARREGRYLHYSTNFHTMRVLIGFLTEKCCSLADASCAAECEPKPASRRRTA